MAIINNVMPKTLSNYIRKTSKYNYEQYIMWLQTETAALPAKYEGECVSQVDVLKNIESLGLAELINVLAISTELTKQLIDEKKHTIILHRSHAYLYSPFHDDYSTIKMIPTTKPFEEYEKIQTTLAKPTFMDYVSPHESEESKHPDGS